MQAPRHVQPFVRPANIDLPGFGPGDSVWRIECSCGADLFVVSQSKLPRLLARCLACGKEITIYDVRFYPAATAYPAGDALVEVAPRVRVFAAYEYSDLDEGEAFNEDDVTWGHVFVKDPQSGEVRKVLDDEAA